MRRRINTWHMRRRIHTCSGVSYVKLQETQVEEGVEVAGVCIQYL
jgi:hypothetical protein